MTKSRNIKNERGQTMAEFTFVLPILVTLLFGIIQFGFVFNNYVTITDAARAGARKAAVSRTDPDPAGVCEDQVRSAAGDLKQTDLAVSCTSPTWQPGDDVSVEADYPYDINLFGVVVKSGTLKTVMKERVE
jgi:Flp pilus assembly protein TadG